MKDSYNATALFKEMNPVDIREPEITKQDVLFLDDPGFNQDNICIVTGASSGIGRATAVAVAANDIKTVGLDLDEAGGEKTQDMARELGGDMVFIKTDLMSDQDIESSVAQAADLGNIRFAANIAGIQHSDSIDNFPMEKYDQMQSIMLRAPFLISKLVIGRMKKSPDGAGVIGNMASIHAHITTLNKPVYNITKFGLRALTQSISAEGEGRIRSFSVSTGFVKTALALKQVPAQAKQRGITADEVVREVMMGQSRVKDMMSPVEVGNLFVFGFSRFAKYLVGGDLLFDGGVVLTY